MSGGSLNYVYQHVENAAAEIADRADRPEHRAFAEHLRKVAKALHDLEWVWSCDYGRGDELDAIRGVISPADTLQQALKEAETAILHFAQGLQMARCAVRETPAQCPSATACCACGAPGGEVGEKCRACCGGVIGRKP